MTRTVFYANLSEQEMRKIDVIATRLGYASRTQFLTSILNQILSRSGADSEQIIAADIVNANFEIENIREKFNGLLDEVFPVIAMNGPEYAIRVLTPDLRRWMYERYQTVPQSSDIRAWIQKYYNTRFSDIQRYRLAISTEQYAEEYEEENS